MFQTMLPGRLEQFVRIPLSSHVLLDGIKSKNINVSKSVTGNNDQNYGSRASPTIRSHSSEFSWSFVRHQVQKHNVSLILFSFHGYLDGIKSKNINLS